MARVQTKHETYDKLFRLFARWAGDMMTARTLELTADAPVTPAQLRGLDFLARRERCSIGELADGLAVSDPAATKLIDRLEGKGLVERTTHGGDRRVVHVALSDAGFTLAYRIERSRDALLEAAIDPLSAHKLYTLVRGLESLLLCALDSLEMVERICLRCGAAHTDECVVQRARIYMTNRTPGGTPGLRL